QHVQPAFGEQGLAERDLAQCEFFVLLSHCPVPVAEEAVEEARASSRRLAWEPAAGAEPAWVLPVRRAGPAWVLEAVEVRHVARRRHMANLQRMGRQPRMANRRRFRKPTPAARAERDECSGRARRQRSPPSARRRTAMYCGTCSFPGEPI